ncbi:MAG: TRAP transporter substrate-binding protein [Deltaproteobacteria bacterium]|nr:MAG: TRAP transporter substrate-binding protein [Deltaproteobacteria bacterium]
MKEKRFSLIPTIVVSVCLLIFVGLPALAQAEPIKLVYTDHNPPTSYGTIHANAVWLDRLEAATGNRIKIERYFGGTLVKGMDAWNAAKTGVADMAWCAMGYWPGMAPLTEIMQLPFVPFKNAQQASGILRKLYTKFPEFQKEYEEVHVLVNYTAGLYRLLTTKKQVKTLEDMKGLKIRALGGPQTDAMKALGAVPTLVPFTETYLAMQKGVLDGTLTPIGACEIFNFHEVGKYMTHVIIATAPFAIIMNKDKWNSLSPDIQKAIDSECGYDACRWLGKHYSDALDDAGLKEMDEYAAKTGHRLIDYTLTPEELARWQEVGGKPLWDAWVKRVTAKGLPGQAVLDELLRLVKTEP